jgi:DNA replication protein DnaC
MECNICSGNGFVRLTGANASRPCECQLEINTAARLGRAGIPASFANATLGSFENQEHTAKAVRACRRFCKEFLPGKGNRAPGILLTGSVGTGKTHLGIACLRNLIEEKGVEGRFVDVRELLDRLRSSFGDGAGISHRQILKPLLAADLVVIDELGAARPTDWVFETIELLIGGLYNQAGTVIVTTNLPNAAPGATTAGSANEYARATRPETLGDRIGARMWSRLQEMCVSVEMIGKDWRASGANRRI